jgi:predicted dehydrogenase
MLDRADVDLVLVATPIPYHFPIALAAVEAGRHVYVQKSMTTTLAEADDLLAARDAASVKLAAAPGFELCSTTAAMRGVVEDGTIGRPGIAYTYAFGFGHERESERVGKAALNSIDPTWYYRTGGGPLPDVGIYSLQLVTSVLGPVAKVTAFANRTASEVEWMGRSIAMEIADNNLVLMEFKSGAIAVAPGSSARGSPRNLWGGMGIYGIEGSLEITEVHGASGYPMAFEVSSGDSGSQSYSTDILRQPYMNDDHVDLLEHHVYVDIMDLVDAIRDDRSPKATGEQARHLVEIIEKAQLAARTGRTQDMTSTFSPGD